MPSEELEDAQAALQQAQENADTSNVELAEAKVAVAQAELAEAQEKADASAETENES